jgi:quercetin dioxygenase-like cupin family protein
MKATIVTQLDEIIAELPDDSIISRTIFEDPQQKVVLFGFAPGQELSEHTASHPAVLNIITGQADLVLGDEQVDAQNGTWIHMPARLPHSVRAKSPLVMLLTLMKD